MEKFKITVSVERKDSDSKYPNHDTIYEQTVEGDETIVNSVVQTVLNYNSAISAQKIEVKL